jgi:hypothetical protein
VQPESYNSGNGGQQAGGVGFDPSSGYQSPQLPDPVIPAPSAPRPQVEAPLVAPYPQQYLAEAADLLEQPSQNPKHHADKWAALRKRYQEEVLGIQQPSNTETMS